MEYIDDAVPFEGSEWRVASRATPAATLHALYRQIDEVLCFGVQARELDAGVVSQFLSVIDAQKRDGGFPGDHGVASRRLPGFDSLGHLSGSQRRFTNGWSNELGLRIVHVFPCFACELSAAWPAHRFASIMRSFNVFDLSRPSSPYIEIKMRGGKSQLSLKDWSHEPLSLVLTYARILAAEPEGVLEVKNLRGDVVVFSQPNGWHAHEERVAAHALQSTSAR